ncbi:hypothetical protein [Candidatus Protochlamydia amoebophila]|uniref:Uncharacterized protein n=1 Tax=Candidatus Protochlamydia amoebophila TaxID=362787 RepID=A0A0C1HAT0_9BACT|nr:hypothetical protein [Candidatus Protochlamydia amoebophila]KIC71913.1 hypothetical protein DB44_CW00860 [Candidatus Protochlamydia amoebophila]
MKFPYLSKRRADNISNGIFLILLGILFYTKMWWPSILFVLGITFGLRQYLMGRRLDFFVTVALVAVLGFITLIGMAFSFFLPILLMGTGFYLIWREYSFHNGVVHLKREDLND